MSSGLNIGVVFHQQGGLLSAVLLYLHLSTDLNLLTKCGKGLPSSFQLFCIVHVSDLWRSPLAGEEEVIRRPCTHPAATTWVTLFYQGVSDKLPFKGIQGYLSHFCSNIYRHTCHTAVQTYIGIPVTFLFKHIQAYLSHCHSKVPYRHTCHSAIQRYITGITVALLFKDTLQA